MELQKLSKKVVKLLSERHKDEYTAHYFYRYVAQCLKSKGYLIASEFYFNESKDELKHAKILEDYANQWNVELDFVAIDEPKEVEGLVESLHAAYDMEYNLLNAYKSTSMTCFEEGDIEHFTFLQQFVIIQNDAIGEYSDKINMTMLFNNSDPSWLFQMEKKIFG